MSYLKIFIIPIIMSIIALFTNTAFIKDNLEFGITLNTINLILLVIHACICYNHVRNHE